MTIRSLLILLFILEADMYQVAIQELQRELIEMRERLESREKEPTYGRLSRVVKIGRIS